MRKSIVLLLIIGLLGMAFHALAEGDALEISIHGRDLSLEFDPSTDYSFINNGMAQASFYAYVNDTDLLYELYMVFPSDVQAGTRITPESLNEEENSTSIVLIESTNDTESYYLASQVYGTLYPAGSHYTIAIDSVFDSNNERRYSGHLTAAVIELNMENGTTGDTCTIDNVPFSFSLTLDPLPSAEHNPFDEQPENTPSPTPSTAPVPTPAPDSGMWKV
jgi:hypothetical protein